MNSPGCIFFQATDHFYQKTKNSHVVFYLFQYLFSLCEEFWNIWGVLLSWFFLFLDFLYLICVSVGLDIFSDLEWQILLCCLLLTAQFLVPLSKIKTDTIIKKHQIIQNIEEKPNNKSSVMMTVNNLKLLYTECALMFHLVWVNVEI